MKTIENNRLTAKFMGIDQVDIDSYEETEGELKYHTSWAWLMPVVEEIDHLEYESERLDKIEMAIKTRQINAVYQAVLEFIKWYNENQNK